MATINTKKIKGTQELLDDYIEKFAEGKIDSTKANVMAKLVAVKVSAYREQLKYKQLTGQPLKIDFFE